MRKINLGCGPVVAKGWIGFDYGLLPMLGKFNFTSIISKFGLIEKSYVVKWPIFRYFDIRKTLPFDNSSVDYIYCSHVLEHFEKEEVVKILSECRRIIKSKGIVRIVLPDLKKLISEYKDSDSFCREFYGYDKDLMTGFVNRIKKIFLRGHEWMYDTQTIVKILKKVGFSQVKVCSYRKGECVDLVKLDLEFHKRLSLYVEAKL